MGNFGRPVFGPNTIPTGFEGNLPRIGKAPVPQTGISVRARYGFSRVDKFNRELAYADFTAIQRLLTTIVRRAEMVPDEARNFMFAMAKWMLIRVYARTPKDTGHARSMWRLHLKIANDMQLGFVIMNLTPYIYYLEYGTRFARPFSMMKLTIADGKRKLKHVLKQAMKRMRVETHGRDIFGAPVTKSHSVAAPFTSKTVMQAFNTPEFGDPATMTSFTVFDGGRFGMNEGFARTVTPEMVMADVRNANVWLALNLEDPFMFANAERQESDDEKWKREVNFLQDLWNTGQREAQGRAGRRQDLRGRR